MFSSKLRNSFVLFSILLAGCGSIPMMGNTPAVKVTPAQIAKYKDMSALDVVATLEKSVNEAKSANMPFLAPRHFREVSQTLSKCQGYLGNKTREEVVNCAAQGDATLDKGRAILDIVNYRFSQELALKGQLDAINTEKLLPKEYGKVIGDLSGLIDIVEREQPTNIDKEKEAVFKAMQELEVKSIQEGALHESEEINADSKKKHAEQQAPLTFAEAEKAYKEAKEKIAANPHDQQLVQDLGERALFAARHASQVNDRVVLLQREFKLLPGSGASVSGSSGGFSITKVLAQSGDKPKPAEKVTLEAMVLQEEKRLLDITTALGLKDMRDRPLQKQVEEIVRAAKDLSSKAGSAAAADDVHLKAANEATRQALAQVVEKDQQLAEKEQQLQDQAAQLAEKDTQVGVLQEKVRLLEQAVKTGKAKASKPQKQ